MKLEEEIKQKQFKNEHQKLVINLLFTSSWLSNIQSSYLKAHDITAPQFNILRILRGQLPNPATITLLMDRMIDKMSNVSRIVDKLERKGLVKRTTCANDRRAVDVIITDKGLDLLTEMDKEEKKWTSRLKTLSDKEAATLNNLLDKLRG